MAEGLRGSDDLMARLEGLRDGTANRAVLGRFGLLAVQRAKERVPRKTGNLDRTIRVGEVDAQAQRVSILAGGRNGVGYARHVEFGTRPHVIRPKTKKALAWGGARRLSGSLRKGAKATNFARVVNHPGTRPRPYLKPGAEAALAEVGLAGVVVDVWNRAA